MRDPQYSHDSYKRSGEPRAYSTNMQVSEVPYPSPRSGRTSVSKNYYYEDSSSSSWGFSDPEIKRRKRIALYKAYGVEGKMKAFLRVQSEYDIDAMQKANDLPSKKEKEM
ncbi:hypothetical protein VitviT2T_021323 [Vitis vinifera]|uniref:Uncharacterized protein n=1 Tax=Vitis vinifera TaxID=29760 RepID=A0ABY9D6M3_VITVI|nr:hypothetical protein VitviT2T_021323 [Vitis vinifera]